jgi:hypothetical protein
MKKVRIAALRRFFHAESAWLGALFGAVVVAFGFFELASDVAEGDTLTSIDRSCSRCAIRTIRPTRSDRAGSRLR